MAVKIRLQQIGKRDQHMFRIVAIDESSKRQGRVIENLGYTTKRKNGVVTVDADRVNYWMSVGAQMTDGSRKLLVPQS